MVTAKTDSVDRILGLELGAHDYVTKPFNTRELLARAKNLIRLTRARPVVTETEDRLTVDGWTLDRPARQLPAPSGEDVALTRAEFDLLAAPASHPGRAMTRETLLEHVSHRDADPYDRTIDVLIGRLRAKSRAIRKAPPPDHNARDRLPFRAFGRFARQRVLASRRLTDRSLRSGQFQQGGGTFVRSKAKVLRRFDETGRRAA